MTTDHGGPRLLGEYHGNFQPLRAPGSLVTDFWATHAPGMADVGEVTRWGLRARIPGHRRLEALVYLVTRKGQRVVESVQVHAPGGSVPDTGVTTDALRRVNLGKIQGEVTEILFRHEREGRVPSHLLEGFRDQPRPGRKGRADTEYAALAVRAGRHAGSKSPVQDLARELGESPATISSRLFRARNKGYLKETRAGRAGCEPTDRAFKVLRGEQ